MNITSLMLCLLQTLHLQSFSQLHVTCGRKNVVVALGLGRLDYCTDSMQNRSTPLWFNIFF